eukprot:15743-Heterococcus_DN1.PRE.2
MYTPVMPRALPAKLMMDVQRERVALLLGATSSTSSSSNANTATAAATTTKSAFNGNGTVTDEEEEFTSNRLNSAPASVSGRKTNMNNNNNNNNSNGKKNSNGYSKACSSNRGAATAPALGSKQHRIGLANNKSGGSSIAVDGSGSLSSSMNGYLLHDPSARGNSGNLYSNSSSELLHEVHDLLGKEYHGDLFGQHGLYDNGMVYLSRMPTDKGDGLRKARQHGNTANTTANSTANTSGSSVHDASGTAVPQGTAQGSKGITVGGSTGDVGPVGNQNGTAVTAAALPA